MKNSKYFPFERNRYFYGKLLSVNDFNLEQKYVNDKRRMTNRFMFGKGIVAGLNTIQMDEKTILLEMGYALDSLGREIVVDEPVIKKIAMIDDFESSIRNQKEDYIYLCLEYDEKLEDQVHNIAGKASDEEDKQYNKIKESYRLFFSNDEPKEEILTIDTLYEDIQTIYFDEGIKIKQIVQKYCKTNGQVELRLEIENTSSAYVAFSYDLVLSCMSHDKQATLQVTFDEKLYEKSGKYTLDYSLDISDVVDIEATATVDPKTVKFSIDKKEKDVVFDGENKVAVSTMNLEEAVMDSYQKNTMERIISQAGSDRLYLAKVFLVNADDFFIIDRIDTVPFKQYLINNELFTAYKHIQKKSINDNRGSDSSMSLSTGQSMKTNQADVNMTTGEYRFMLGAGAQKGQIVMSEELVHNLGLGDVTLQLGIERADEKVVFGNGGIFGEDEIPYEVACKLDKTKGSFIIGLKLLKTTMEETVTVSWTALQSEENVLASKIEKKILIKPSVMELGVRESYIFEAACENMVETGVLWKVRTGAGTIDSNGLYTAPNKAGVYEIIAESVAYPDVKASIFVVVREEE